MSMPHQRCFVSRPTLVTVACSVLALLISTAQGSAATITSFGTIAGVVNGQPVNITTNALIDTTGVAGNSATITFMQLPSELTPLQLTLALGTHLTCIVCAMGVEELGASNLFTLTGGNYDHARLISYLDFPGSFSQSIGTVTTLGNVSTYSLTLLANYAGPTDLIGIMNYSAIWEPAGDQIQETACGIDPFRLCANLLRAGGAAPVEYGWLTTYSHGGLALTTPEVLTMNFTFQQTSPNSVQMTWNGSVTPVPEPGTILLVGAGLAGVAARSRKRPKSQHSDIP